MNTFRFPVAMTTRWALPMPLQGEIPGLFETLQIIWSQTPLVDGQIECPKHNGRFDAATGEATREPACDALRTYAVREVDGEIVADLA